MLLYAIKGNKQLQIENSEKATYLKAGYDIGSSDGKNLEIIERSPNSVVSFVKYEALEDKLHDAESDNESLKKEIEALRKEVDTFKKKQAEAQAKAEDKKEDTKAKK